MGGTTTPVLFGPEPRAGTGIAYVYGVGATTGAAALDKAARWATTNTRWALDDGGIGHRLASPASTQSGATSSRLCFSRKPEWGCLVAPWRWCRIGATLSQPEPVGNPSSQADRTRGSSRHL